MADSVDTTRRGILKGLAAAGAAGSLVYDAAAKAVVEEPILHRFVVPKSTQYVPFWPGNVVYAIPDEEVQMCDFVVVLRKSDDEPVVGFCGYHARNKIEVYRKFNDLIEIDRADIVQTMRIVKMDIESVERVRFVNGRAVSSRRPRP